MNFFFRISPEKTSRDSGVITPSEGGSLTSPDNSETGFKPVNPDLTSSKPVYSEESSRQNNDRQQQQQQQQQQPVKAAVVTSELDDNRFVN